MTPEEQVQAAYEVLSSHFGGFSAAYIQQVLEYHFWSDSDAGWQHMRRDVPMADTGATEEEASSHKWTLRELRAYFSRTEQLEAQGQLSPARRYIHKSCIKHDAKGKLYIASDEELQQDLAIEETMGIDPDGNLVRNGQVVISHWLQSFNKPDDD